MSAEPHIARQDGRAMRWLAHVDRSCLDIWLRLLAPAAPELGPEIGEHMRLVDFPEPVAGSLLTATGLARFVMPVTLVFAASHSSDTTRHIDALAALAAEQGAQAAAVFAVRRHGRFAAAALASWAATLGPAGEPLPATAPVLMLALTGDQGYAGVTSRAEAWSPWAGGRPPPELVRAVGPSRAGAKLAETLAWLATTGTEPAGWQRWLELGAYPGGMTAELARRGHKVLAVDVHPPSPAMLALPGVSCIVADAAVYEPPGAVDALLCDVNGSPSAAVAAVARLARHLRPGGLLVHTLKLPAWGAYPELRASATRTLAAAGISELAVRHLWHNRQEVTLVGRRQLDAASLPSATFKPANLLYK